MHAIPLFRVAIALLITCSALPAAEPALLLGTLQSTGEQAAPMRDAGISLAVMQVSWDRFQPERGETNSKYVAERKAELVAFRSAGIGVVLDLGVQYPPDWIFAVPGSRYVNQYGDAYQSGEPGMKVANSVFSAEVRTAQADYYQRVFQELGTEFHAVRLGGGWFGELNYPPQNFAGRGNCYWAYDPAAQGALASRPEGIPACPVPGWLPGTPSQTHAEARAFLDWYLGALGNYHDWQIRTVRARFPGRLMMLYPSWGIRPGQAELAVAADLSGDSPPERNGEITRGFDFARFIAGIRDPLVGVHCTWMDSDPSFSDDTATDPARWSPLKYLGSLARAHQTPLALSGENTGGGGFTAMRLCAQRARDNQLTAFFWAFQGDLLDGAPPELADLRGVMLAP